MKKQFLFLALFVCSIANAQPVIKNQLTIGGTFNDEFRSMYPTKDGGYIVGGSSASFKSGEKTQNSRGSFDYWVVKLDRKGNIEWDKTIGGSGWEKLSALQQTSDGGYILGGTSNSNISGEKTQNSYSSTDDYWVVKLDPSGNIQWDKTIGGSRYDYLRALQQTTDGGYILGGYSESNISGDKTQNSHSLSNDYWVVKLDPLGNIQWDKTIGGNLEDYLFSLQQTTEGGYILGGYSYSDKSGEKTQNGRGGNDYWVVKLNSLGSIQWDKTIGGSSSDDLLSLDQTRDGGYILGGYSYSNKSGEKTEDSRGYFDYWAVKINGSGKIEWDKTIGGSSDDDLQSIKQTIDGGYILGGYSKSDNSGEKTENSRGGDDYWVVKLNGKGKFQWDKTIGGTGTDYLYSVNEVGRNWFLLGGTSSSGVSGDKTEPTRGRTDYWMVLLNYNKPQSSGIASSENNSNLILDNNKNTSFKIYPNPVKDMLHITVNGTVTFLITSQSGKILIAKTITNEGEISMSGFSAGMYYIKNSTTGKTQKLIVTK